jgi:hypothetical protein
MAAHIPRESADTKFERACMQLKLVGGAQVVRIRVVCSQRAFWCGERAYGSELVSGPFGGNSICRLGVRKMLRARFQKEREQGGQQFLKLFKVCAV